MNKPQISLKEYDEMREALLEIHKKLFPERHIEQEFCCDDFGFGVSRGYIFRSKGYWWARLGRGEPSGTWTAAVERCFKCGKEPISPIGEKP